MAHVCFVAHHRHLLPCSGSSFSTTTSKWRRRSSGCSFFFSGPLRATATSSPPPLSGSNGAPPLNMVETKKGPFIMEIPLDKIRRPLSRTRANDPQKVKDLMLSISEIGLQEPIATVIVTGGLFRLGQCSSVGKPTLVSAFKLLFSLMDHSCDIDVLEVDGVYYGFSGCHRYEAHQRLGLPTIRCKVRKGTRATLRHHLR